MPYFRYVCIFPRSNLLFRIQALESENLVLKKQLSEFKIREREREKADAEREEKRKLQEQEDARKQVMMKAQLLLSQTKESLSCQPMPEIEDNSCSSSSHVKQDRGDDDKRKKENQQEATVQKKAPREDSNKSNR